MGCNRRNEHVTDEERSGNATTSTPPPPLHQLQAAPGLTCCTAQHLLSCHLSPLSTALRALLSTSHPLSSVAGSVQCTPPAASSSPTGTRSGPPCSRGWHDGATAWEQGPRATLHWCRSPRHADGRMPAVHAGKLQAIGHRGPRSFSGHHNNHHRHGHGQKAPALCEAWHVCKHLSSL
jgi:hypothetical protein